MKEKTSLQFLWIIVEYEQIYSHKFDSLDEVNLFLESHNLPKLTQEKTDNLNSPICILKIESIINKFPEQKAPGSW